MRYVAAIGIAVLALYALTLVLRWKAAQNAAERMEEMHISDEQAKAAVNAAKYNMGGGIASGLGNAIGGIAGAFGRAVGGVVRR